MCGHARGRIYVQPLARRVSLQPKQGAMKHSFACVQLTQASSEALRGTMLHF